MTRGTVTDLQTLRLPEAVTGTSEQLGQRLVQVAAVAQARERIAPRLFLQAALARVRKHMLGLQPVHRLREAVLHLQRGELCARDVIGPLLVNFKEAAMRGVRALEIAALDVVFRQKPRDHLCYLLCAACVWP